ncbi:MAG TPA: hypothetical protein VE732_04430 [Nitrososphaera sp.]|nr:hypothetical protein [Nitrososphaera sp.]
MILLLAACNGLNAQSGPCPLTIEQLPEVRGFKLGMTLEQIKKRHPNFRVPAPDQTGYSEIEHHISHFMSYGEESVINEADRKGLQSIKVAFLDNKLVKLRVTYDDSVEWENVTEFFKAISNPLKLPEISQWDRRDKDTLQLSCDDNTIQISLKFSPSATPSITFAQHGIDRIRLGRERASKEKQKQDFKP